MLVITGSLQAQITALDTLPVRMSTILTLQTAGPKFISTNSTGFTLYNEDLSVFTNAVFPPAPPGYTYFTMFIPTFMTETLFDTDPTTIEFAVNVQNTTNPSINGTRILRTDGTVLLDDLNHIPYGWSGPGPFATSNSIMNTPEGTRMVLSTSYSVNPPECVVYALPGSLPCLPCSDEMQGWNGDHMLPEPAFLTAFPNPAGSSATVRYTLPPGTGRGWLVFFTLNGAEVKRIPVDASGVKALSTTDLTPATYLYQLITPDGPVDTQRLIVVE